MLLGGLDSDLEFAQVTSPLSKPIIFKTKVSSTLCDVVPLSLE
jgi:hypothetical protein